MTGAQGAKNCLRDEAKSILLYYLFLAFQNRGLTAPGLVI
jgi:hypothetical protein